VVSETLNSNTINLLAGLALPALVLGQGRAGHAALAPLWLVAMTLATLLLLARRRGLTRTGGIALIVAYLLFVGVRVARPTL
jgi:Ca2+/Na+ antiporter